MSQQEKLVLLTGASGFLGTRVQNLLVERRYHLRVLTRKPDMVLFSVSYTVGDLADASAFRKAVDNVDVVIHVAGEKRALSRFWLVNVQGTKNLLDVAVNDGVERFVHVSSVGVIGADPYNRRCLVKTFPVCREMNTNAVNGRRKTS